MIHFARVCLSVLLLATAGSGSVFSAPRFVVGTVVTVADGIAAYERGDLDVARKIFLAFAEVERPGTVEAWFYLGLLSSTEESTRADRDDAAAVVFYRFAAERGLVQAQFNLALMYAEGRGVERDPEEAVRWYRLAAAQGDPRAVRALAIATVTGEGVERDTAAAARLFGVAAAHGDPESQYHYALLCVDGWWGSDSDPILGYAWLSVAAAQDHAGAVEARDLLEGAFKPDELARAWLLAAQYQVKYLASAH